MVWTLIPATFLPAEEGEADYNCAEVTDEVCVSRPDLWDQAIQNPELTLCSDSSSYLQEGIRRAGHALTTEVIEDQQDGRHKLNCMP